jgi:hypothetical protein
VLKKEERKIQTKSPVGSCVESPPYPGEAENAGNAKLNDYEVSPAVVYGIFSDQTLDIHWAGILMITR